MVVLFDALLSNMFAHLLFHCLHFNRHCVLVAIYFNAFQHLFCQQTIEYRCLSRSQGQLVIQWVPSIVVTFTLFCAAHCQCPVWGALQKQATCSIVSKCVLDLLHSLKIAHQIAVEPPCKPSWWRLHKPFLQLRPLFFAFLVTPETKVTLYAAPRRLRSNNASVGIRIQISVCWWIRCTFLGTTIQHHAYVPCHCSSNILLVIDYVHLSLLLPSDEIDSMLVVFLMATCCVLHVL